MKANVLYQPYVTKNGVEVAAAAVAYKTSTEALQKAKIMAYDLINGHKFESDGRGDNLNGTANYLAKTRKIVPFIAL